MDFKRLKNTDIIDSNHTTNQVIDRKVAKQEFFFKLHSLDNIVASTQETMEADYVTQRENNLSEKTVLKKLKLNYRLSNFFIEVTQTAARIRVELKIFSTNLDMNQVMWSGQRLVVVLSRIVGVNNIVKTLHSKMLWPMVD